MVGKTQVTEFMEDYVVTQILRDSDEIEIQVDIPFPGATAPV